MVILTYATFRLILRSCVLTRAQWNSGWPIQVTTPFAQEQLSKSGPGNARVNIAIPDAVTDSLKNPLQRAVSQFIGSTDSDSRHLDALNALQKVQRRDGEESKPVYMAAVSPWFFTHYGQDSFNKNVSAPKYSLSRLAPHRLP